MCKQDTEANNQPDSRVNTAIQVATHPRLFLPTGTYCLVAAVQELDSEDTFARSGHGCDDVIVNVCNYTDFSGVARYIVQKVLTASYY